MTSAVYSGVAAVLVVAVVAVAYGSAAPQLGLAEFAPAARRDIAPPPTTAGESEARTSGGRGRSTTTQPPAATTTTAADAGTVASATTRVSRSRQCVGNPPRQTEDPQAPPCVGTIFEGDNGGATARGVSATEIRIGVAIGITDYERVIRPLFDYMNARYEFYGRRLVPVFLTGATAQPAENRAFASDFAALDVFAVLPGAVEFSPGIQVAFFQELARQGVVAIARGAGRLYSDATLYDQAHPYLWSVHPSAEDLERNLADFACSSLAGKPARHAGSPTLQATTRKFGVLVRSEHALPASRPLIEGLRDCGVEPVVATSIDSSDPTGLERQGALRLMIDRGVTTVICLCTGPQMVRAYRDTAVVGFKPEWLLTTDYASSEEANGQSANSTVGTPVFGLVERPRMLPWQAEPWFQVLQQVGAQVLSDSSFFRNTAFAAASISYTPLALLAAGVQGAGPALSAESFAAGLMTMQFPNPGAGAAPYYQPSVGFGAGDHSFYDDYALAWWSATAEPLDPRSQPGRGSFCYVGGGTRYRIEGYPSDDVFFDPGHGCR